MRAALILFFGGLIVESWRDPHFWRTADQRGERLLHQRQFGAAAKAYADPWRIGVAQYRDGDFTTAAKTFARVPGADGAFDQGNAWLMRGNYNAAIAGYDRALGFRPGWKAAEENKALASARQAQLEAAGKERGEEQTEERGENELTPDAIAFDQKPDEASGIAMEMSGGQMSDAQWRAVWLRRVQTTPADFLRMKFAYQAAQAAQKTPEGKP